MAYRVEIGRNAHREFEELYLWVMARTPCPVASESINPDQPVRVLRYGRKPHVYRIFFTVNDDARVVHVVHVRRGARRPPPPDELKGD